MVSIYSFLGSRPAAEGFFSRGCSWGRRWKTRKEDAVASACSILSLDAKLDAELDASKSFPVSRKVGETVDFSCESLAMILAETRNSGKV